MPTQATPQKTPPSHTAHLDAKLAKIAWLHQDNIADPFPSFQARLADALREAA